MNQAITRQALKKLLRPLVRLMIAGGRSFPEITALLKELFVEEAIRRANAAGLKPTDSRISIATGLQRRDVKAIRSAETAPAPRQQRPTERLVQIWSEDPDYRDASGAPIPLPRRAEAGAPSFETLCLAVTRDIHPRTLLDELTGAGRVRLNHQTDVAILCAEAAPALAEAPPTAVLALADHAEAVVDHLLNAEPAPEGRPPYVERSTGYHALSPASVAALNSSAERIGRLAIDVLDKEARRLRERDAAATDAAMRLRFGVFAYHAPEAADEDGPPRSHSAPRA